MVKRTEHSLGISWKAREKAELEEFRARLPLRILNLAAQADKLGIGYRIVEPGPTLELDGGDFINGGVSIDSGQSEVERVELILRQKLEERNRKLSGIELAKVALQKLTAAEIAALKENGYLVK